MFKKKKKSTFWKNYIKIPSFIEQMCFSRTSPNYNTPFAFPSYSIIVSL